MAQLLDEILNPYNLQIVMTALLNGLLALSVWLPLSAGQLSLGAAGFMSIGAYTAALLSLHTGIPVPIGIAAGAVAAALAAFLVGFPALRLTGVYVAIATLAFGEMIRIVALNLEITNGALGLSGLPNIRDDLMFWLEDTGILPYGELWLGQGSDEVASLLTVAILALLLALVVYFAYAQAHSRPGRALAAIRLDETAAKSMGINVTRYKLTVFAQSGLLAGLAGGLYAHLYYFIGPSDFSYGRAIESLLFAVLGGMETVWGPLLGAGAITIIPEALRWAPNHRAIAYGAVLLVIITFAPRGILTPELLSRWRRRRAGKEPQEGGAPHVP